jgi:ferredoxin
MALLDQFVQLFGVWEEARPYLPMIVDPQEMALVVAMRGEAVTAEQAADRLGIAPQAAAALLERCYARSIVDREADGHLVTYTAKDFYARLDHYAKFENWDDIPVEGRRAIDRRFLDEFIARHGSDIARKIKGLEPEGDLPNETVLLLDEVEEMLTAARLIIVQPCDCRRLGQYCDRPVETCIWLDDLAQRSLDRGFGRVLAREEAIHRVRWADRKGLMHTGDSQWRTEGLHAICNCCACDCYPFRAAQELGSKGVWPKSRHIAVYSREQCNLCGACVKRCHFAAFYHSGAPIEIAGTLKHDVAFAPERCWGCGLCANTCPSGAITMEPLP